MNKYSDQTLSNDVSFVNLPVESFNKITWRGGDDKLSALLQTDPGLYLGEFRSMVQTTATKDKPAIVFPKMPWNVVTRKSGTETYQRYSATEMRFRPIAARVRYVLYERDGDKRVKDANGRYKIKGISKQYPGSGSGYVPQKEVFGFVMDENGDAITHGLLSIDAWSTFISYNSAVKKFEALTVPENKLVIYKLGTRGKTVNGEVFQKQVKFGDNTSVDIEALDLNDPEYISISPEFDDIWEKAQPWANCERWHSERGAVAVAPVEMSANAVEIPSDEAFPELG